MKTKSLLTSLFVAVTAIMSAQTGGYELTQTHKVNTDLPAAADARQGAVANSAVYIQEKAGKQIQKWTGEGMQSTMTSESGNTGICTDDAGNVILSDKGWAGSAAPTKLYVYPADGGAMKTIAVEGLKAGRMDFMGHVRGDILGAKALACFPVNGSKEIVVLTFKNGEQVNASELTLPNGVAADNATIAFFISDEEIIYNKRNAGNTIQKITVEETEDGTIEVVDDDYKAVTPEHGAHNGCDVFTMGGETFVVYPITPNYTDGFAIAKLSNDNSNAVIVKHDAELTTNPNGTQNSWVYAQVNSSTEATIYQYVPGGYLAEYKFEAPKMYVIGEVNGGSWAANGGTEMTRIAEGVYEITATVNNTSGGCGNYGFASKLGVDGDDWDGLNANRYGPQVDGTILAAGHAGELYAPVGAAFKSASGEYKMTVNLNMMKVLIENDVPVEYPEKLYVCGHLEESTWDPANTSVVLMPTENEGEYAGFVTVVSCTDVEGDANYGYGFVGFSSTAGTWDEFNANRLGAETKDLDIKSTETKNLKNSDNSFRMLADKYYMVADLKNMTLSIIDVATGVEGVGAAAYKVIGGEGRIAVEGDYKAVAIYGANGALLSKQGNYECAKGMYIVVVDGKAEKIIVR